MSDPHAPPPEFSRPIDVARIGSVETVHEVSATPDERVALARRLGLLGLDRLEARIGLRCAQGGTLLYLVGRLTADVVQACVVTLEPVANHLEEGFTVIYGRLPEETEVSVDVDDDSVREPWPEGPLDIGEAVAQELAISLDPYPHAAGAVLKSGEGADSEPEKRINPFSVLANLRKEKP